MADHGVRLEQGHAIDDVLALADERGVAVLPGVAAVEQDDAVAALGPDGIDDRGDAVEAADPPVGAGQRDEILAGQRMGCRGAARDIEVTEKISRSGLRRIASGVRQRHMRRRFAQEHRDQLRMQVGDMDQRDIAERRELEQLVLTQPLLREGAAPRAGPQGREGGGGLQKFASRRHRSPKMLFSPIMTEPSPSRQRRATDPSHAEPHQHGHRRRAQRTGSSVRAHHAGGLDLIHERLVRPFPETLRLSRTYWIICPKATALVSHTLARALIGAHAQQKSTPFEAAARPPVRLPLNKFEVGPHDMTEMAGFFMIDVVAKVPCVPYDHVSSIERLAVDPRVEARFVRWSDCHRAVIDL